MKRDADDKSTSAAEPRRAPKLVFIVPYRDREPQRFFFQNYMTYLMEDYEEGVDYLLFFVEQMDSRPFNRGAMKNIGFRVVKDLFPDSYKDVILVFNDVDVLPYKKGLLRFEPPEGGRTIMHHYGFEFALGGIFSIRASDFESINGFANYWSWGFEDNLLQSRAKSAGIHIDRSNFFALHDMRILHINDGNKKSLNRAYMYELIKDTGMNGITTIQNLNYTLEKENNRVCVHCFDTEYSPWNGTFEEYDLRNGRDLSAPLTKEMMLTNARMGKNIETLHFIDAHGKKQTIQELMKAEEAEEKRTREQSSSVIRPLRTNILGFTRPLHTQVTPKESAGDMNHTIPTNVKPIMQHAMRKAMMSNIRMVEDRRNSDRQSALESQQRNHFKKRYGNFGLRVHSTY